MKKRHPASLPLTFGLFFTLVLGLIPVTPAFGDNITACQGSGSSSSSIKLGGRSITPTLILQAATGQICPTGETSLGLVSLSRTLIISPVITPTTNGSALLAAITRIANSNPSSANPWLLKLEPGNYDLGTQTLPLLSYVDLEGSGEGITVISSTASKGIYPPLGVIVAASNSEIRSLQIVSTGTNQYNAGIVIKPGTTNARFSHVTVSGTSNVNNSQVFSLLNNGGSGSVSDSTFSASSPNFSNALYNDGGTIKVNNSAFTATGNTQNYAFNSNGGTSTIGGSTFSVSGTGLNYAFQINNSGSCTITNSTLNSTGGSNNFGFLSSGASCLISSSSLSASGGSESDGLFNSAAATTTVTNSTLSASGAPTSYGLRKFGGTALVFNSLLSGSTAATIGMSDTDCTYSVNATTHAPLNASCQ